LRLCACLPQAGLCESKKKIFCARSRQDAKASGWQELQKFNPRDKPTAAVRSGPQFFCACLPQAGRDGLNFKAT